MKTLVVYSSLTGNTKMVAEAVAAAAATKALFPVEESPAVDSYDLVAVGFWVDRGTADTKAAAYLALLRGKKIALFATLGADPHSEHAKKSLANAAGLLDGSNTLVGTFICQGKVDPALIARMAKHFPAGHPHGTNEERRARHAAASTHPDAQDLLAAKNAFAEIRAKLTESAG